MYPGARSWSSAGGAHARCHLTAGKSLFKTGADGIKLSEVLHLYYCVSSRKQAPANTAADRITRFSRESRATLLDQTKRFAANYAYASEGKWSGLWSDADKKASENSVNAFWTWLTQELKKETSP